jgi:HTH-type transcriptional regulator/antitoxin HigA
VLNRRRPLSLEMIRRLHVGLGLPADTLIQPYGIAISSLEENRGIARSP